MIEEHAAIAMSERASRAEGIGAQIRAKSDATLRLRSRVLVAAFTAAAIVSGVSALARARTRVALGRLLDNPTSAATESLFEAGELQGNVGIAFIFVMLGTAIAMSLWMYSALTHRSSQGARTMSPASGGWAPFVPIANALMPWLVYRDLHQARHHATSRRGPGDLFAVAWWLAWLASLTVLTFGPDATFPTSATAKASANADLAAALLFVMAATLGAIATLRVSAKVLAGLEGSSADPAASLSSPAVPVTPGPVPVEDKTTPITGALAGLTIVAGAAAFCVAIVAVAPATIANPTDNLIVAGDETASEGETLLLDEIPPGMCLPTSTDLSGEILFLKAISCDNPHKIEVVSRFDLDYSFNALYPGLEKLDYEASRVCLDDLYDSHGLLFEVDPIVPLPILPLQQGWTLGDRSVTCLVEMLDETTGSLASIDARVSQRRSLTGSFGPLVGQCANDAGPPSLEIVPCDGPHEYEMMAVDLDVTQTEHHSGDDVEYEATSELCSGELFGDYVGVEFFDSIYDIVPLYTLEGVFEFTGRLHRGCLLIVPQGTTGSLLGANE